jgi:hypothetical protein
LNKEVIKMREKLQELKDEFEETKLSRFRGRSKSLQSVELLADEQEKSEEAVPVESEAPSEGPPTPKGQG